MTNDEKKGMETELRDFCKKHDLRALVTVALDQDRVLWQLVGDTEDEAEEQLAEAIVTEMKNEYSSS